MLIFKKSYSFKTFTSSYNKNKKGKHLKRFSDRIQFRSEIMNKRMKSKMNWAYSPTRDYINSLLSLDSLRH